MIKPTAHNTGGGSDGSRAAADLHLLKLRSSHHWKQLSLCLIWFDRGRDQATFEQELVCVPNIASRTDSEQLHDVVSVEVGRIDRSSSSSKHGDPILEGCRMRHGGRLLSAVSGCAVGAG